MSFKSKRKKQKNLKSDHEMIGNWLKKVKNKTKSKDKGKDNG